MISGTRVKEYLEDILPTTMVSMIWFLKTWFSGFSRDWETQWFVDSADSNDIREKRFGFLEDLPIRNTRANARLMKLCVIM